MLNELMKELEKDRKDYILDGRIIFREKRNTITFLDKYKINIPFDSFNYNGKEICTFKECCTIEEADMYAEYIDKNLEQLIINHMKNKIQKISILLNENIIKYIKELTNEIEMDNYEPYEMIYKIYKENKKLEILLSEMVYEGVMCEWLRPLEYLADLKLKESVEFGSEKLNLFYEFLDQKEDNNLWVFEYTKNDIFKKVEIREIEEFETEMDIIFS